MQFCPLTIPYYLFPVRFDRPDIRKSLFNKFLKNRTPADEENIEEEEEDTDVELGTDIRLCKNNTQPKYCSKTDDYFSDPKHLIIVHKQRIIVQKQLNMISDTTD